MHHQAQGMCALQRRSWAAIVVEYTASRTGKEIAVGQWTAAREAAGNLASWLT